MNFFALISIIITTPRRCVYALFVAWKLKVEVKFFPYISNLDLEEGNLDKDVFIKKINVRADTINAQCSIASDKEAIHNAIESQMQNGFDEMNRLVEKIRLTYLLEYPVNKILRNQREAIEKYLVPSITTMVRVVHPLAEGEMPNYKTVEAQSKSSNPIEVFLEWKKLVESKNRGYGF